MGTGLDGKPARIPLAHRVDVPFGDYALVLQMDVGGVFAIRFLRRATAERRGEFLTPPFPVHPSDIAAFGAPDGRTFLGDRIAILLLRGRSWAFLDEEPCGSVATDHLIDCVGRFFEHPKVKEKLTRPRRSRF